jgi:hypothetical protein
MRNRTGFVLTNAWRGAGLARALVAVLALLMTFLLVACGGDRGADSNTQTPTQQAASGEETKTDPLSDIAKTLQSKGRPFNSVTTGKVGETLTNTFFAWTVNSVSANESITMDGEEVFPNEEGYKFVIVDITTKNVFDQPNPMGSGDFSIIWTRGTETIEDIPFRAFVDEMYPDEFTEEVGQSTSGWVVFEVPQDVNSAMIGYYELWDDNFEGDTYLFEVTF